MRALDKENKLKEAVVKKAMERAKFEDLHKDPRLKKPGDPFYGDLLGYAMKRLSYYQCFKNLCDFPSYYDKYYNQERIPLRSADELLLADNPCLYTWVTDLLVF